MAKATSKPAAKTAKALAKPAKQSAPKKAAASKAGAKSAAAKSTAKKAAPFCWYELTTTDAKAASKFYAAVVGWSAKNAMPGMDYTIMSAKEYMIAGIMPLNDEMKARQVPPCWTGYIHVPDTDAFVKKAVAAGGKLARAAEDIPTVGRFAVVTDPHGASFILFTPAGSNPNPPPAPNTPGHVGWHELMAGDLDSAFKFYAKLFGWTKSTAVDMGPMGTYQLVAIDGADKIGMMTKMPDMPFPCWGYYFNVEAIDAATARVKKAKGTILNGPMEVPGGSWIVNCLDPQGAQFSLVAPKR